jgi:hypothetical protein
MRIIFHPHENSDPRLEDFPACVKGAGFVSPIPVFRKLPFPLINLNRRSGRIIAREMGQGKKNNCYLCSGTN